MEKSFYLSLKESPEVEFKQASEKLPLNIYETYSAFANTNGGTIYLGIKEIRGGENVIAGVSNPEKLKTDFSNTVANSTKVSADLIREGDITTDTIEGKTILIIRVRKAPISMRPVYLNGNPYESFRRNGIDGDARLSKYAVLSMLNDANKTRYDALPNSSGIRVENLCQETIKKYRLRYQSIFPGVGTDLDDFEFLKRVGAVRSNAEGLFFPTNGCIALFGYAADIRDVFPCYKVDFMDQTSGNERYDYRLDDGDISWSGNLFDFLFAVVAHIAPILPNAFHLNGIVNDGGFEEETALREGVLNAIFNCNFFLPGGIRIIQKGTNITIENTGRMIVDIEQAKIGGDSQPRNEGISILLRAIGLGERSGFGIPSIFGLFEKRNWKEPILKETFDREEKTVLSMSFGEQSPAIPKQNAIVSLLLEYGMLSSQEIATMLEKSRSTITNELRKLQDEGIVEAIGSRTNGKKYKLK